MATIYQLKKYLQGVSASEYSSDLLAYLQCFHSAHLQDLEPQVIEQFYLYLMQDFENRSKQGYIKDRLVDELQPFYRRHMIKASLDYIQSQWPFQIILIEKQESLLGILERFYQSEAEEGENVRVLPFGSKQGLVLYMKKDGHLCVYLHTNSCVLKQGQLAPITSLCSLYYNAQLELEKMQDQFVTLSGGLLIKFQKQESGIECLTYNLKDLSKIRADYFKDVLEMPDLFDQLKKIESQFIQPQSDPHYKKLINSLQSSYQLLLSGHVLESSQMNKLMDEARRSIKDFYSKDRLLLLLIANIEFHLKKRTDLEKSSAFLRESSSSTPPPNPSV